MQTIGRSSGSVQRPTGVKAWLSYGRRRFGAPCADISQHGPPVQPARASLHVTAATGSASSKAKRRFVCTECGEVHGQYAGRCRGCGKYGSVEEQLIQPQVTGGGSGLQAVMNSRRRSVTGGSPFDYDSDLASDGAAAAFWNNSGWATSRDEKPEMLYDVAKRGDAHYQRLKLPGETGAEVARVLGGGVVPDSLVLIGGDPGIGKSTLLLQVAAMLASQPVGDNAQDNDGSSGNGDGSSERLPELPISKATAPPAAKSKAPRGRRATAASKAAPHAAAPAAAADFGEGTATFGEDTAATGGDAGSIDTAPAAHPVTDFSRCRPVLYISAEESNTQVGARAMRMGLLQPGMPLYLLSENRMEAILDHIQRMRPVAVVVDSIQTVVLGHIQSSPGSLVQVRECSTCLQVVAKQFGVCVFLIGHVTKDGSIAGPKNLEHLVDVVLYLEGEQQMSYRLLRAMKNRFGRTGELGIFSMEPDGLTAVRNPSLAFLNSDYSQGISSAITVVLEGSRPILVEIQALCSDRRGAGAEPYRSDDDGGGGNRSMAPPPAPAIRNVVGLAFKRLSQHLAVLDKHTELRSGTVNIFLSVVAGYKIKDEETASDLAIAAAIASSYWDTAVPRDVCLIGELGLGGEVRPVRDLQSRLTEVAKLGFKRCIIPAKSNLKLQSKDLNGMSLKPCNDIREVFAELFFTRPESEVAPAGLRAGATVYGRQRSNGSQRSNYP